MPKKSIATSHPLLMLTIKIVFAYFFKIKYPTEYYDLITNLHIVLIYWG